MSDSQTRAYLSESVNGEPAKDAAQPSAQATEPRAKPGQLRDAFLPNRRVRLASDVASACALGILAGLLTTAFTWDERIPLFELASSPLETIKLGMGYLIGPLLILVSLPLVLGRSRQVALRRRFRTRLALAALLWVAGLVVLVAKVTGLDDAFAITAGTYVTATFLVVGLVATLAMWPTGLRVVKVDRAGIVRDAA
jgi:hypothetical protein